MIAKKVENINTFDPKKKKRGKTKKHLLTSMTSHVPKQQEEEPEDENEEDPEDGYTGLEAIREATCEGNNSPKQSKGLVSTTSLPDDSMLFNEII